jgi:hypothetical protein
MPEYAKKIYFPEHWHPFHAFFPDSQGRLFVMTYEPGTASGDQVFDIFNKDGVLTARRSLNVFHGGNSLLLAAARKGCLYLAQEKESGFKQLTVYHMIWN